MALSRKEVLEQYNVDRHGLITDFGKFEREPLWVPALWDAALGQEADEDFTDEVGRPTSVFFLDAHDYKEFPELKDEGIKVVVLWEEDNGFVRNSTFATKAEYEKARQEMEASRDPEAEGPQDDDLVTEDERRFYTVGRNTRRPVVEVDAEASRAETWEALEAYFAQEQYWPNVWIEEERGGYRLFPKE